MNHTVICLVGPTACHKSETAVVLAKALSGEIVSADSVAVYRGLDIGSAKPTMEERQGIPHHMIDVADITDVDYTVARFRTEARDAIRNILQRDRLPIVVGGSGLYSDAVFSDMSFSAPSDSAVRAKLEQEYDSDPNGIYERLKAVDPEAAARIHLNDAKRVVRAMEVYLVSGRPYSAWNRDFAQVQRGDGAFRVLRFGLNMDRARLYDRINLRVDRMFALGLQMEAYALFDKGFTPDRFAAMQSIGYAQMYDAYRKVCTVEQAHDAIQLATRHFAKRQLTWFKRNPETRWYSFEDYETAVALQTALCKEIQSKI